MNKKYRFVLMTDDDFKERFVVRLSFFNTFVFALSFLLFFVLLLVLVISYSPLKEYIPGKTSSEVQKQLFDLTLRSDSLQVAISQRGVYLQNVNTIISGKTIVKKNTIDSASFLSNSLVFEASEADSLLRVYVESEETGSLFNTENNFANVLVFFKPVDGFISDVYNKNTGHFGVDLVAKKNSPIYSVLEGVVVINHWTPNTGYVVGVHHPNGFLSLYKHNSLVVKSVGDFVVSGEKIAVIGNSGEFSSGPHLHFELWHNGSTVNPKDYIIF